MGGGAVGARKVRGLLDAGFEVTVVSPTLIASMDGLDFAHERRKFELEDVARHGIVFACTNDRSVNEKVGHIARMAGKPVIVTDSPDESTAFSTAVFRDGLLQVGVSTAASAPGMATEVRDRIAKEIKGEFADRIYAARSGRRPGPD